MARTEQTRVLGFFSCNKEWRTLNSCEDYIWWEGIYLIHSIPADGLHTNFTFQRSTKIQKTIIFSRRVKVIVVNNINHHY